MAFHLSDQEKKTLLTLVRDTITQWIENEKKPVLPEATENLKAEMGAFVTLHKKGNLRGCIGHMIGTAPLIQTIQNMAIAASTEDPRFPPVQATEISDLDIEISVLSPMKRIQDVSEIEVGTHGILLGKGWQRGVLLPQVATEQGWNRDQFIEQTCLKAGLSVDAWKDEDTIIEIFSAEVFGEDLLK